MTTATTRSRVSACPDGTYTGPTWPWLNPAPAGGRHRFENIDHDPKRWIQHFAVMVLIEADRTAGRQPQHERCECRDGEPRRGRHRSVLNGLAHPMRRCVVSAIVQH